MPRDILNPLLLLLLPRHGQAHQEPSGAASRPRGCLLCVSSLSSPPLTLLSAPDHFAASLHAFFWPKVFWDFATKNLDAAVRPVPVLQIVNILLALAMLAWEWPLGLIADTFVQRSVELRIVMIPMCAMLAVLLYQGTPPALYYLIGLGVYCWGYTDGEVICPQPWTVPKRRRVKEVIV